MKKIYYILIPVLLLSALSFGQEQDHEKNREKMKAFKTAYITDAIELTSKEAQKFWPIYNAYEEKTHNIRRGKSRELYKKIKDSGGLDKASNELANEYVQSYLDIDIKLANEKKALYKDLRGVFSSQKAVKLLRAEHNFSRELLKRFREDRQKK